jgi:glycosyltransferase involved in cell wall biosynthesis
MIKVLYVVSTLERSGPINVLYNIVKYLNRDIFMPYILTLSPEPINSRWKEFESLGVNVRSLNLSRIKGLLFAKNQVHGFIKEIIPDIIHTHGLRADSILSTLSIDILWTLTIHNYSYEDYVMRRGKIIGCLVANYHIATMKKCKYVVACSKNVAERLLKHHIKAYPIQNGVDISVAENSLYKSTLYQHPVFITTGGLPRKNVAYITESFKSYKRAQGTGSLLVLGNETDLSATCADCKDIYFLGYINNVCDYYSICDYFISSSLSEGLPNAVLEALACGLPSLLSDIPSHREIAQEFPQSSKLFALNKEINELAILLHNIETVFSNDACYLAKAIAQDRFSGKAVSQKYQIFYNDILSNI